MNKEELYAELLKWIPEIADLKDDTRLNVSVRQLKEALSGAYEIGQREMKWRHVA